MRRSTQSTKTKLAVRKAKTTEKRAAKRKKVTKKKTTLGFRGFGDVLTPRGLNVAHPETVNGTDYEVAYLEIPLVHMDALSKFKLMLWEENARFAELEIQEDDNGDGNTVKVPTQKQMFSLLSSRPDVKRLVEAMKTNAGCNLGEPLVVVPVGGGKFETIEGNERTVAAILCHTEDPDTFPTINVKVYKGLTKSDALLVLATTHGNGKSPWGAKEKARLHYCALKETGMEIACYASHQRLNPTRLKILIGAYLAVTKYESMYESTKPRLFTYFTKLIGQSYFRELMGMQKPQTPMEKTKGRRTRGKAAHFSPEKGQTSAFMRKFMKWMALNKLTDCTNVDNLPLILEHEPSRKMFEEDDDCTYVQAWNRYCEDNPQFGSEVYADMDSLTDLLENLSDPEKDDLKSGKKAKVAKFQRLIQAIGTVENELGIVFEK